ncbi:hypothetical protein JG688_00017620 [Phytophthora aleatoria]|uniref:Uncharacterized protein n=1 Tax=Phytophthora aleatoria TaxID=2496075 RepID=A0A8J5MBM9_9STRA|nr:hypothetical protein JG688_00017620 [Phytophthora aleatoria]
MTSMQEEIESIGKTAPGYGGIGLGIETEDYRCFSAVPRQELVRSTFYPDPRQSLVRRCIRICSHAKHRHTFRPCTEERAERRMRRSRQMTVS